MDSEDSNNEKPKIQVERRRRPGAGGAAGKPRAETPQRREQRSPGSSQTPKQTPKKPSLLWAGHTPAFCLFCETILVSTLQTLAS
jgi:hypothetical protein